MMKRGMQKIQGPPDSYDSDFRSNVALFAFAMKICEQIGGNYQDYFEKKMAALKEKGLYKYTGDMDLTGKSKGLYI